jgi:hypothetical protein
MFGYGVPGTILSAEIGIWLALWVAEELMGLCHLHPIPMFCNSSLMNDFQVNIV